MAYNTNTRLLLNFGGSGSTPVDTSQHAHDLTYGGDYGFSATGDPFGGRALVLGAALTGHVALPSPAALFSASGTLSRTIDFWAYPDSGGPDNNFFLVINFDLGDSLTITFAPTHGQFTANYRKVYSFSPYSSEDCYISVQPNWPGDFNDGWHHFRLRISGNTLTFGMDGAEVAATSITGGAYLWTANQQADTVTIGGFDYGSGDWAGFKGKLDAFQVLEGDNSWTGGSYTVPSTPPDDYSGGPVELFAFGANTLDNATSAGYVGLWTSTGDGENTVDNITSTGTGFTERFAAGANTLASITSTTPPLPPAYKESTKLLIKFNEALTYDSGFGLNYSKDTSAGNRKVFLELPAGLEQVGDVGMFNTPSMRFGTPFAAGGAHTRGRMFVDSPAGLFSDNSTSLKRFDLWYRREATATSDLSALFTITFQNGDFVYLWRNSAQIGVNIKKSGTEVGFVASYNNFTNNVWRHIRLLLSGGNIYLAADGQQRALYTHASGVAWPGHGANPINGVIIGDFPPSIDNTNYGLRGCLDAIEWLEGDIGYTGGDYTVPTQEPGDYDPYATAAFYATGANTTGAVTSTGTAVVLTERTATGQNTTDDITAFSAAGVTASASGQNTLEAVTSLGRAEDGVWWTATGANTTANVTSTGTGTVPPIRYAEGRHALDEVTSTGSSLVSDRIATGQNTLDALTTVADGTTAGVVSGQNTVTTTSSGTATVLASATGANTLDDATSSATSIVAFNAVSQVLTEVFSVGTATVLVSAVGENTVSVTSTGAGKFEIFGQGGVLLDDVTAQATTTVLCAGSGSNALDDVRTYFPAGYFDAFIYEVVRQQRNEHWVKQ